MKPGPSAARARKSRFVSDEDGLSSCHWYLSDDRLKVVLTTPAMGLHLVEKPDIIDGDIDEE